MLKQTKKLADCRVLISNDDGLDAPGLALLTRVAKQLFGEVWVVAPAEEQSAKSRGLTIRQAIEVDVRGDKTFAVHGTPVDCIVVALNGLMKDQQPDLVLSGINNGSNLAEDIGYSGTVGCAFEAALHKIPAIAFSQCYLPRMADAIPWQIGESQLVKVIDLLWQQEHHQDLVYNVNFPPKLLSEQPQLKFTTQGRRVAVEGEDVLKIEQLGSDKLSLSVDLLRRSHMRVVGSDLQTIDEGHVSITKIGLEHGFRG